MFEIYDHPVPEPDVGFITSYELAAVGKLLVIVLSLDRLLAILLSLDSTDAILNTLISLAYWFYCGYAYVRILHHIYTVDRTNFSLVLYLDHL